MWKLGIGGLSSLHETDRNFCVRENGSHSQFSPLVFTGHPAETELQRGLSNLQDCSPFT